MIPAQVAQADTLLLSSVTVIVSEVPLALNVKFEASLLLDTISAPLVGLSDPLFLSQVSGGDTDEVILSVLCVTLVLLIVALTLSLW